eukprot:4939052-Pyramimonas_sp.AAC.1
MGWWGYAKRQQLGPALLGRHGPASATSRSARARLCCPGTRGGSKAMRCSAAGWCRGPRCA